VDLALSVSRLEGAEVVIHSFRDITDHKRQQLELQRTKDFLERLVDGTLDGIIAADPTGTIILFNQGAEQLLGYAAEDVLGKMHVTALYPDGGAREVMRMLRSHEHGGPGRLRAIRRDVLHRSGEMIPVQMSAVTIEEGGRLNATVGIFSDLRERMRIEGQLLSTQEKLERSERQAMIVELAGTAAHELNQPLTSVMGYAELLKRKLKEEDPSFRAVDIIFREAERMAEIVRKIGRITRYETKHYVGRARIVDLDRSTDENDP
jgi:PAS domain S-box-containing protein